MAAVGRTRVGKYELGRTLGEGTFAKVKFAKNLETGENVAIKIFDKDKILRHKMVGQVKKDATFVQSTQLFRGFLDFVLVTCFPFLLDMPRLRARAVSA